MTSWCTVPLTSVVTASNWTFLMLLMMSLRSTHTRCSNSETSKDFIYHNKMDIWTYNTGLFVNSEKDQIEYYKSKQSPQWRCVRFVMCLLAMYSYDCTCRLNSKKCTSVPWGHIKPSHTTASSIWLPLSTP